jgi:hypothetical protein
MPIAICDALTDKAAAGVGKTEYVHVQHNTVNSMLDGYVR